MRPRNLFFLLLALTGIAAAQDSNFPVGPQYLMNYGSPLFLRPIATPSLSFQTPPQSAFEALPEASNASSIAETGTGSPSLPASIPALTDLSRIYWGGPTTSADTSSEIEISSAPPLHPLPPSILDVGVTGMTNAQSLRERGFGVSLGEAGSFWKIHRLHAAHLYTNRDIQRLHGG